MPALPNEEVGRLHMSSKSNPQRPNRPDKPKAGDRTVGVYDRPERKQLPVNYIVLIAVGLVLIAVVIYFLAT